MGLPFISKIFEFSNPIDLSGNFLLSDVGVPVNVISPSPRLRIQWPYPGLNDGTFSYAPSMNP